MDLHIKPVTTATEREQAFHIRRVVFQFEQAVDADLEFDGLDDEAEHFLVKSDSGEAIATARVRYLSDPMTQAPVAKIERLAVLANFRGLSVGKQLMTFLLTYLRQKQISQVKLHAQTRAQVFYQKLGFEAKDGIFDDAGIPHIAMYQTLTLNLNQS